MSVQLIEKAQYSRCYECGDTKISYICHHCGRAMCKGHGPNIFNSTEQSATIEFADLGLKNTRCGEVPAHCTYCDHIVRRPNVALIVLGIISTIIGVVFLFDASVNNIVIGMLGNFLGLILGISGVFVYKKRKKIIWKSRPPFPSFPKFGTIKIREQWHGNITLGNDCTYNITTLPVKGNLGLSTKFTKPDRDRLQLYRQKYKLNKTTSVQFHSGFIIFKGPIGFKLADTSGVQNMNGLVISLKSDLNNQPYLNGTSEREGAEWVVDKEYTLLKNPESELLPIRIVPSLIQKTGRREFELEIQWEEFIFNQNELESNGQKTELAFARIELLELLVPLEWGEVEELIHDGVIGKKNKSDHKDVLRTITWKKPPITKEEREDQRCRFFIRFENKIDLSSIIQGRVEITFERALSAVEGIDIYYPVGTKNNEVSTEIETNIIVDFHLSLKGIRYQDVRLVPNPKIDADKDKQEIMTFEGVIPNHATVVALTNAISSNEGFYVQRVVEDPPRTGKRAHFINRYWDIAGRHYIGVYPIDFHLTVSGEEKYSGEIRAQGGTTKTILIVQGMYANRDMEDLIENVWEQLSYIIKDTLEQLDKTTPVKPKEDIIQAEADIDTSTSIVEERLKHFGELHKHLDNLMEAFTAARVFENTYMELKTRIEKELQALQSSFEALKNN